MTCIAMSLPLSFPETKNLAWRTSLLIHSFLDGCQHSWYTETLPDSQKPIQDLLYIPKFSEVVRIASQSHACLLDVTTSSFSHKACSKLWAFGGIALYCVLRCLPVAPQSAQTLLPSFSLSWRICCLEMSSSPWRSLVLPKLVIPFVLDVSITLSSVDWSPASNRRSFSASSTCTSPFYRVFHFWRAHAQCLRACVLCPSSVVR